MKRFLLLVGVAVVAGAMYVAASPASQQASGPTLKQFNALKKQVATLNKKLKNTTGVANLALGVIVECDMTVTSTSANVNGLGVSQFGSATNGFLFGANSATALPRTGLDVAASAPQHYLQEVAPNCVSGNFLRHAAGRSTVQHWAERNR
jgi:hypothetical protein